MAKNEKENAKPNTGLPAKIAINAGTQGSVITPPNLGVPTPSLPFDPMAAMNGVMGAPQGPQMPAATGATPDDTDPNGLHVSPDGMPPAGAQQRGPTFPPDADTERMVQGLITHWDKQNLKNLITYAAHLLTVEEKKNKAE
jgi:hypothetical protein